MPRPRFDRLDPKKRERIIEAAAQEFGAYGFDGASLNRILASADISKGAAYYYFDDKADLFGTVVMRYWEENASALVIDPDSLTTENFWPTVIEMYKSQFAHYREKPWMRGAARAVASLPPEDMLRGPLREQVRQILNLLGSLFERGRTLGVIRGDLPPSFLLNLIMAFEQASDRWVMDHWSELDQDGVEAIVDRMLQALRRAVEPPG